MTSNTGSAPNSLRYSRNCNSTDTISTYFKDSSISSLNDFSEDSQNKNDTNENPLDHWMNANHRHSDTKGLFVPIIGELNGFIKEPDAEGMRFTLIMKLNYLFIL